MRPARALAIAAAALSLTLAGSVWLMTGHSARHPAPVARPADASRPADPSPGAAPHPIDPAYFASGSCVAFPPTSGDTGKTVFLDAGHGGPDPGGVGITSSGASIGEARVDLRVELLTAALLRSRGYRVVVSRTRNSTVLRLHSADEHGGLLTATGVHADVAARDVCANMAHADVLVGIYLNAGAAGDAGSLTAYDAARAFAAQNRRLAALLQHNVLGRLNAAGFQIPDDGVVTDSGLGSSLSAADQAYGHLLLLGPAKAGYFSTPSLMPGALIEPLFITDPFEASIAASAQGQRIIAAGIAAAVEQYFAG